jgi:hypothetical protein
MTSTQYSASIGAVRRLAIGLGLDAMNNWGGCEGLLSKRQAEEE